MKIFLRRSAVVISVWVVAWTIALLFVGHQAGREAMRGWMLDWWTVALVSGLIVALGCMLFWATGAWGFLKSAVMPNSSDTSSVSGRLENLERLARAVAFGAGAVFILLKLLGGHFYSSAEMDTHVVRSAKNQSTDFVGVKCKISTGTARSVRILDVQFFDQRDGNLPIWNSGLNGHKHRSGVLSSQEMGGLMLNPGDVVEVIGWTEVPRTAVLPIKVVVLGLSSFSLDAEQWVGGTVSLPLTVTNRPSRGAPSEP